MTDATLITINASIVSLQDINRLLLYMLNIKRLERRRVIHS